MYSLNMPVSAIRTKIRQEFERHRYVAQLRTVDVLIFNSHQEFQVWCPRIRVLEHTCLQMADQLGTGDSELLEAADARTEVFQSGGRSEGEATEEFHPRFH